MNDEAGSGREPLQKDGYDVLEQALDETDPFVVDLRDPASGAERALGKVSGPVLWQSFEGIKANETALRLTVHLRPESDALSRADTEFEEIDCGPAAYLVIYMVIEVMKVFECRNRAPLLRNPLSNQSITINPVKRGNVPWK